MIMRSSLKWIFGILIGLLVVVLVVGAIFFLTNNWMGSGWWQGSHSAMMWHDERVLPRDRMPMAPNPRVFGPAYSGFSPLRFIGGGIICLGFLGLLTLGTILLVMALRKPASAVATQASSVTSPSTTPVEVTNQPSTSIGPDEAAKCSNCQKTIQKGWEFCPYCGQEQT
jgi:hypothetical protein